jgi:hypothetical protein
MGEFAPLPFLKSKEKFREKSGDDGCNARVMAGSLKLYLLSPCSLLQELQIYPFREKLTAIVVHESTKSEPVKVTVSPPDTENLLLLID